MKYLLGFNNIQNFMTYIGYLFETNSIGFYWHFFYLDVLSVCISNVEIRNCVARLSRFRYAILVFLIIKSLLSRGFFNITSSYILATYVHMFARLATARKFQHSSGFYPSRVYWESIFVVIPMLLSCVNKYFSTFSL